MERLCDEMLHVLGGNHAFVELLKKNPTSTKLKKQVLRDLKLELRKMRVMASFLVQGSVPASTKKDYKRRFLTIQRMISALDDKKAARETGSMCKLDGGIRSCDLSAEAAHRQLMGLPSFRREAKERLREEQSKCFQKVPSLNYLSNNPHVILDTVSTLAKQECIEIQLSELK